MWMWHRELWLIDNRASLYFLNSMQNWEEQATKPFSLVKHHVLLSRASQLEAVNEEFRRRLTPALINHIVSLIPDGWLHTEGGKDMAEQQRNVYREFLLRRINSSDVFTNAANDARQKLI